jgi:hypothetical protein
MVISMIQYIVVFLFFILAFSGFVAALHFSQYKKRASSGCCGGGHCSTDEEERDHSCYNEKIDFVDNYKKPKEA